MAGIGIPELTVDDLAAIQSKAWRARHKWYNIGLQLGLKADDLDCIHGPDDNCFREMLKQWLRQKGIEKTWDKLSKALQSETVNYGDFAESIATQTESATNRVDHDPTPEHHNKSNVGNASKLNDNQKSNQYADHSAEHDQCTAMLESPAIEKPKRRGFICPCGQCSIEQFLETGCPPQLSSKPYPFLDTESLTDHERYDLIFKLNEETKSILSEFSNLINHMIKSFKEQEVEPQDIRSSTLSCASHCSGILKGTKTINDIIDALIENGYLSFYHYYIAKHLIKQWFKGNATCGQTTVTNYQPLDIYETKFYQFCKRSIFEVPQGVFARNPPDGEILAFKVTSEMARSEFNTDRPLPSTFVETSSKVLNLTLEDTITIQGRIATSLGLKNKWSLIFLRASKGCIELNFSISTLLYQELKPQLNITEATELDRKTGIISLEASGIHLLCGPPSKPYVSEVTNDSVTLKWSKPEYTGLHPPTGYRIYCRSTTDRPDTEWMMNTEGPVESLVVKNPSTHKGSFIVQAINEIGAGVMSEESDLMILTTSTDRDIPSGLVSYLCAAEKNSPTPITEFTFTSTDPAYPLSTGGSTTDQSDKWMMNTKDPIESLVVRNPSTDKGSYIVQAINENGAGVTSTPFMAEDSTAYEIWTRLCHSSYNETFSQHIDLPTLIPCLYEEGLIDHRSKIANEKRSISDRIGCLLDLLKNGGPETCGEFIQALEKEDEHLGHRYIQDLIRGYKHVDKEEIALSSRIRKRIEENIVTGELFTKMNLEASLAGHMYSEKLMTEDQLVALRNCVTTTERNKMILELLNSKGPLAYIKFLHCLKEDAADSNQAVHQELFRLICNDESVEIKVTSVYRKRKARESEEVTVTKRDPIRLEIEGELVTEDYLKVIQYIRLLHNKGQWDAVDKLVKGCENRNADFYVAVLLESCTGFITRIRPDKVEETVRKARELCKNITNNCNTFLRGRCEWILANLYRYTKENDKALEHIIMARDIQSNIKAGEDSALCNYCYACILMESLANRFNSDEYKEAKTSLELAIDHANSGDFGLNIAHLRIRLAQLYLGSSPQSRGTRTDEESLKKARSSLDAVSQDTIAIRIQCIYYYTESDLYRSSGEIEKAKHSAQKALSIAKKNNFFMEIEWITGHSILCDHKIASSPATLKRPGDEAKYKTFVLIDLVLMRGG
jgi:tetratricopeptide (TPR) repeat protein